MTRRPTSSIVASPVLVGAVTLLIAIVAVFLAYNANAGLPFVPTYDLKAELRSGGKLVVGNEVRVGGFRVGLVRSIDPAYRKVNGGRRAVALVGLKLDKRIEPLAADSSLRVRPRSPPLGLKYVELTPGRSRRRLAPGDTVPLEQTSEPRELEDVFATFDEPTRPNLRAATQSYGDALAGRGPAMNEVLEELDPFLRHLRPVMRSLSDPDTRLRELFPQLAGTLAEVAPVAETASALLTDMADSFAAVSEDPGALRATIARLPPTLAVATRSLRLSRPVLTDLAELARRLRPAAAELPRSAPPLTAALRTGTPVLGRSVGLSRRLRGAATRLRDLLRNPSTLMSLHDLRTALAVLRPLFEFIAPYQTVCNYSVSFVNALGEHQSQPGPGGTVEPQFVKAPNLLQPNSPASTISSRSWDLPPGQPAQDATFDGAPAGRLFITPYHPAIDAQGNADCQLGQVGYPNRRLVDPSFRRNHQGSDPRDPNDVVTGTLADGTPAGGNAVVYINDYPGLVGGTYKARQLGIENLRDVP